MNYGIFRKYLERGTESHWSDIAEALVDLNTRLAKVEKRLNPPVIRTNALAPEDTTILSED